MKMKAQLKKKWIKALVSGEYGQLRGKLTDGKGSFCCHGVLQHVASGGKCEVYENDGFGKDDFRAMPTGEWFASAITHRTSNSRPQTFRCST